MTSQVICASVQTAPTATLLTTASANRKPKTLAGLRGETTGRPHMGSPYLERPTTTSATVAAERMMAAAVNSMSPPACHETPCRAVLASARRRIVTHRHAEMAPVSRAVQMVGLWKATASNTTAATARAPAKPFSTVPAAPSAEAALLAPASAWREPNNERPERATRMPASQIMGGSLPAAPQPTQ